MKIAIAIGDYAFNGDGDIYIFMLPRERNNILIRFENVFQLYFHVHK